MWLHVYLDVCMYLVLHTVNQKKVDFSFRNGLSGFSELVKG